MPDEVRAQVSRDDREIRDPYERQDVVTGASYVLRRAGLLGESDALLTANLSRSHSAYYLMAELADNARARGDSAAALRWYGQAFDKSVGPATRLQWGAMYVAALVDLAPQDGARIEKAARHYSVDLSETTWRQIGVHPQRNRKQAAAKAVAKAGRTAATQTGRAPATETGRAAAAQAGQVLVEELKSLLAIPGPVQPPVGIPENRTERKFIAFRCADEQEGPRFDCVCHGACARACSVQGRKPGLFASLAFSCCTRFSSACFF